MLSPGLKFLRLVGHILVGLLLVLLRFPSLNRAERAQRVTRWAARLLAILAVRVSVRGEAPPPGGALVAANHVSWLDIHLLHSLLPARFISKAEVRNWPVFGRFAEASGTVFLVREKKADAMRVNQLMAEHLRDGDCLALFPEGTTSDGTGLRPFFPSLFQPAVEARATVWPARIRYLNRDGTPCGEAAYYGEISLGASLMKILTLKEIHAEVAFLPPIASAGLTRRELARAAEEAIRCSFSVETTPP
ncbi:MAG: lysophospholipid acyltransferase family protein [Pseudomonadota bacterium]|nr:lysophospholipid acyltransferase family protein [Pseudomonadota bacterium]MDP1906434.1 lysophospholipid acyltransferase family protein [Pseudomonadota bacterium]MDP2351279.1 lysophospholipid acyltransferase family protein [Pseudomonadota bacterium]